MARKKGETRGAAKGTKPRKGSNATRAAVTELQMEELESAIRRQGWSPLMAGALAKRWGCKKPRVYALKKRVLDKMTDDDDLTLESRRSQFLAELRDIRNEARGEKRFGPVSSLLKMEAQILGLFAPVEIRIDANPVAALSDSELEAILMAEEKAIQQRRGQVIEAEFSVREVKGES